MLVKGEDLAALCQKVTLVAGGFDPLHEGHVEYFRAAGKFGLPVLCSVDPDSYVQRKHPPLLRHEQRCAIIDALRNIDYTYANPGSTAEVLRALKPRYFIKGNDWTGQLPVEEQEICVSSNIEVRHVDTKLNSSSAIVSRFTIDESALSRFEETMRQQAGPAAQAFSAEYFQETWRRENNEYTLEVRRKIEGRHPEVIRDVFRPDKVLDLGCGPGILMYLLAEVGVSADGVDLSPSSRDIAAREVRDRIRLGSIVDVPLPDRSYDLVICREVLEHMPIGDITKAVANMCRISARYVYLTTRFHPAPEGLLDVTDERQVDPTHITLLNKNLLRLMFVLNGFHRRPDLEERMDWLQKRRVLVYERSL